jgi:hypothetical protein
MPTVAAQSLSSSREAAMTDKAYETQSFRYTVTPGISSPIALTTVPHATCTVRQTGAPESQPGFKVYADPDGIARVHVHPSGASLDILAFDIECEADGKITHYRLDLRASHEPSDDMPAPPEDDGLRLTTYGSTHPALSDTEMLQITDDDLLERGYPHRPDRDQVPRAFQAWRRVVSSPITVIEPHTVSRPDVTHGKAAGVRNGPQAATNWCGFELLRALKFTGGPTVGGGGLGFDQPYDWVHGRWHVPQVVGEFNRQTYSSLWVGLDGDGTTDLVQAGTESDSIRYGNDFVQITLSTFYAWTEFLPQQPTSLQVTNFPVNPGDDMLVEVWIGNAGSGPTLAGAFGVFLLMNLTTGISTRVYTPVAGTRVGGGEAVWIIERPTLNIPASGIFGPSTQLPDLANFGSAVMSEAYARKANSPRGQGYVSYFGTRTRQVSMVGKSGDTLSTVTPIDAYSMRYDWKSFS